MRGKFIDKLGLSIALITLVLCFVIFYRDTIELGGSLTAALMTSGLVWVTYIVMKWLLMANRS
jgi:archaellum biogenesis protein FlaJ (TadC family)